jgi:hypothetical protein
MREIPNKEFVTMSKEFQRPRRSWAELTAQIENPRTPLQDVIGLLRAIPEMTYDGSIMLGQVPPGIKITRFEAVSFLVHFGTETGGHEKEIQDTIGSLLARASIHVHGDRGWDKPQEIRQAQQIVDFFALRENSATVKGRDRKHIEELLDVCWRNNWSAIKELGLQVLVSPPGHTHELVCIERLDEAICNIASPEFLVDRMVTSSIFQFYYRRMGSIMGDDLPELLWDGWHSRLLGYGGIARNQIEFMNMAGAKEYAIALRELMNGDGRERFQSDVLTMIQIFGRQIHSKGTWFSAALSLVSHASVACEVMVPSKNE